MRNFDINVSGIVIRALKNSGRDMYGFLWWLGRERYECDYKDWEKLRM
jgi:hypothetical protein